MAKKTPLPDSNVTTGELVRLADKAMEARVALADAQEVEKEIRDKIAEHAEMHRTELAKRDEFIGIVRVTGTPAPVRIEFRQESGAIDLDQEGELKALFEQALPLLFQRAHVVNAITDNDKAIEDLRAAGLDPWDIFDLKLKKGMEGILANKSDAVESAEALVPTQDLMHNANKLAKQLSTQAKDFIREFLNSTLSTKVVLGTKGTN